MSTHIKVLGWLHIIFGVFGLFTALAVFGGTILGSLFAGSISGMVGIGLAGSFAAVVVAMLAIPGFIAGYGLLKFRPWARILTIVLSVLQLIHFPYGTALGVYGLWVLLSSDGAAQFRAVLAEY